MVTDESPEKDSGETTHPAQNYIKECPKGFRRQ